MFYKFIYFLFCILPASLILNSCIRNTNVVNDHTIDSLSSDSVTSAHEVRKTSGIQKRPINDTIVGDTVWVNPYASKSWSDTLLIDGYSVVYSVWVDTTDFIVDTVRSSKGDRIVIGFNHYYMIDIDRGTKHWFVLNLNKKEDFRNILEGTDSWLESNLDVFKKLTFNKKYNQFIVEFSINSHSNLGSLYYIVFDINGQKKFIGTANSWGGEGPDGDPFLTQNNELFVTCFEIYNFSLSLSSNLSEFIALAESKRNEEISQLNQIHGLRNLGHNNFLAVFNRIHDEPFYNAFVLRTDTTLISRFCYHGIVEEMDAILLYAEDQLKKRSYLFDSEREQLICIDRSEEPKIFEISIVNLPSLIDTGKYLPLNFNLYGLYEFYTRENDTMVYVRETSQL